MTKELDVKFSEHGLMSKLTALIGLAGIGLAPQLAAAPAAAMPTWEYTLIARSAYDALSDPALDRSAATGLWQVAFGSRGGQWLLPDQQNMPPGIHFIELGSERKTLVKTGDLIPQSAGIPFCFADFDTNCGGHGPLVKRVSLSQGEVAFAGGSHFSDTNPLQGIYTFNGQRGPTRIADTSMTMPDFASANFGTFDAPSLNLGRVAFHATSPDLAGQLPAMDGVYGNFDGLATVRVVDKNSQGSADILAFGGFGTYASVARSDWDLDQYAVAFGALAKSRYSPNWIFGAFLMSVRGGVLGNWSSIANELDGFGQIYSPAVAFRDQVAFYAEAGAPDKPAGIYASDDQAGFGPKAVATEGTAIPGETGTFQSGFGLYPSVDMYPRQPGQAVKDRWIAFTVSDAPTTESRGVYLSHDHPYTGQAASLERVIDEPGMLRLLAPYLSTGTPPPLLRLRFSLFHQAAKEGALAFRVSVRDEQWSVGKDFIVLARKTAPTLTLKPDADTYVRADLNIRRNDNYGLQDFVHVGTGRADVGQSEGDPDKMRAFLHFNTAMLPKLALTSAALELTLHSYDNGRPDSVYNVDAHAVTAAWSANKGEGNGFEGARPQSAPTALTDPDSAWGIAWAGAGLNPDPYALNNSTQPSFNPGVLASQRVRQQSDLRGAKFLWDITELTQSWLNLPTSNFGVAMTDVSSAGDFRSVRFGSREGEIFTLPNAVAGPRLALKWPVGTQPGDFTGNACVDRDDMTLLLAVIRGQAEAGESLAALMDLNTDGKLDIADSRTLVTLFTKPLGAACK